MFPAATVSSAAVKPVQPAPNVTAQKTSQPQAPETARTSTGESAAANIKAETSQAVQAPEQSSVAPRLRDQETAENSQRSDPVKEDHTGPPPSFEESPLERQARVAFDPPDVPATSEDVPPPVETAPDDLDDAEAAKAERADPPPTSSEKAEASFSETRTLAEAREPVTVDVRN